MVGAIYIGHDKHCVGLCILAFVVLVSHVVCPLAYSVWHVYACKDCLEGYIEPLSKMLWHLLCVSVCLERMCIHASTMRLCAHHASMRILCFYAHNMLFDDWRSVSACCMYKVYIWMYSVLSGIYASSPANRR